MKVRQWAMCPDLRLTTRVVAGRYRLEDLLGRGGAADVYEGLDLRLRRPVAVKFFRPGGDAQTEERFGDEGRLLAHLQHPGLVTVYDSGHEDGRPYLVMQLIRGTTLRRRIAAAPLPLAEVCRIGSAMASTLAHVHEAGIVHRDVKPSNILLDETDTPYLTDFGISRMLDTTAQTATGVLIGTAAYMAPEQVLGQGAGPAADIYSLGLVLLEALKGDLEYEGTPLEAAIARLHRPPVVPPDLPRHLAELLKAMTASDEGSRPDARTCYLALAGGAPGTAPVSSVRSEETHLSSAGSEDTHVSSVGSEDTSPRGRGLDSRDHTLHAGSADGRTGTGRAAVAGPATAATAAEGHPTAGRVTPAPTPHRAGRALLAAGVMAALGVTLTGSIGGLSVHGDEGTARPVPRTASEPPLADPPPPRSSAPVTPASASASASTSASASASVSAPVTPSAAEKKGGGTNSAPTGREAPASPAWRSKPTGGQDGQDEAARGPANKKGEPPSSNSRSRVEPPKKHKR